ncbi:hypothetical protein XU18_4779 [Perkinsela sp. CCAP 1560/4]|nr:hypothetical protein XU18_4779 [Perkinsela sp. CCAP 1560/4]|eukprot:KNH03890.1 hypothetical protein XU18_4779 [Perkinsela sp. CCAP 1560/4]
MKSAVTLPLKPLEKTPMLTRWLDFGRHVKSTERIVDSLIDTLSSLKLAIICSRHNALYESHWFTRVVANVKDQLYLTLAGCIHVFPISDLFYFIF